MELGPAARTSTYVQYTVEYTVEYTVLLDKPRVWGRSEPGEPQSSEPIKGTDTPKTHRLRLQTPHREDRRTPRTSI